ncbi:mucolipin [Chloropicon primus]|uniref:Mucolipin n=1 Tax=Chloropicon primus TaxID=1764295 RepID=A0A5B8MMX9_9CHLO|nr:mucolipin [Chloropicon primus]UPR00618.1 mucolipin [Chloropicon primus]|eukprot:QDZ21404.1 mucolipin [Chloropicon primus]
MARGFGACLASSTTDPLLVRLLEQADKLSEPDERSRSGASSTANALRRLRRKKWSSQFTSLTDVAGWMAASPWYKWKQKGRIPVKLFLHLSIAILSLFQVVFLSTNMGRVIRNTRSFVDDILVPTSSPVYNLTGLVGALNTTMCDICAYERDSLLVFELTHPFQLTVERLMDGGQIFNTSRPSFSMDTTSETIPVYCSDCPNSLAHTDLDLREKTKEEKQELRHSLSGVGIQFNIQQLTYMEGGRYCLNWDISLYYAISMRLGTLSMPKIETDAHGCGHWPTDPINIPLVWVNVWLLIFSCFSFVLVLRQFGRHYQLYSALTKEVKLMEMGAAYQDIGIDHEKQSFLETWSKLKSFRKTKFFSLWNLFTIATNIMQVIGSLILLLNHGRYGNVLINTMIGLAASGALLNMVRYFRFFPKSYLLILTLRYALPKSLRFIFCATVIYLAYAVLGMTLFGERSPAFSNLGQSVQTLFSIVNGDHITEYFEAMRKASNSFVSRVYVFSFIFLCMWVALNILLGVVIEGYNQAVERVQAITESKKDSENHEERESSIFNAV